MRWKINAVLSLERTDSDEIEWHASIQIPTFWVEAYEEMTSVIAALGSRFSYPEVMQSALPND